MKIILLSTPDFWPGEQETVKELFDNGLSRFHLRKPKANKGQIEAWLSDIPLEDRSRIVLHQSWELIHSEKLGGLHFPEWYRTGMQAEEWQDWQNLAKEKKVALSTSVHDPAELSVIEGFDYVLLSPVFPSISKPGYQSQQRLSVDWEYPFDVYALGGVEADKLPEVARRGFDGAAFLGAIWQKPQQAIAVFQSIQQFKSSSPSLPSTFHHQP